MLDAPQRPSAAVPRRSQEVLRRSMPGRARRHGIVNLPAATRDIDQAHVRVKDLEPFGLSRAGDADVQDGEVEMRDTVSPQLVHELRIASFQIPSRVEVASADLPFDRDFERGHERLDHQNGDLHAIGCPLLVREVVGVVDTERPRTAAQGSHDSDRPKPLERPPLVVVQKPVRALREVDPVRYRKRPVHFKRAYVLPDRGVKGAIRLDAVIVRPLLATRLLLGRRERRYAFPVLRILHHEPFRGLRERDDVVALSEKMHPFAVEDLQHLVIGRHVVGFQEGLARDRHQLRIEDSLSDPIGAPVPFVPVVRPQHSFENRLELSLGVFGSDMFVSTSWSRSSSQVSGGEGAPSVRLQCRLWSPALTLSPPVRISD